MTTQNENLTRANIVSLRRVRISPKKARPVVDLIRNQSVIEALELLSFTPRRVAPMLIDLIESAVSNIENDDNLNWDLDELKIAKAYVDEGPTLRRIRPRAQGRATRINKRTSHITLVLEPRR